MITADINYATQFITTEEHTLLIDHNFVDSPVEHFRKLFGSSRFNTWAKTYPVHFSAYSSQLNFEGLSKDSLDKQDLFGWPPLMYAAATGNDSVVLALLEAGADPKYVKEEWLLAFVNTVLRVSKIISQNGRINEKDACGRTHLLIAARAGSINIVQRLLKADADVFISDKYGWGPLHWAARKGHEKIVNLLVQAGAEVKKANDFDFRMQLFYFVEINSASGEDSNTNNGFDPINKDDKIELSADGLTASVKENTTDCSLRIAYLKQPIYGGAAGTDSANYVEFELLLIGSKSISIGVADPTKLIIGSQTISDCSEGTLVFCVNSVESPWNEFGNGPNITDGDTIGCGFDKATKSIFYTVNGNLLRVPFSNVTATVLFPVVCFQGNRVECSVRLKLRTSLCDRRNLSVYHNGCSALHLAAEGGYTEVVRLLLGAGADPNQADKANRTPLFWAASKFQEEVAVQLIEAKAVVDDEIRMALTPCLTNSIKACLYSNITCYVKCNVNWKDSIRNLTDAELKNFALNCNIVDLEIMSAQRFAIWSTITAFAESENIVKKYLSDFPNLIAAKDSRNRPIINLADPVIADIIRSMTLYFGRYKMELRPDYISATCFVFKAVDEMAIDSATGEKLFTQVALKLMKFKEHFVREIKSREIGFDNRYVMNIIRTHLPSGATSVENGPPEIDTDTGGTLTKVEAESMYCLVMPLADRNLFVAMKQERFAGRDIITSTRIFRNLVDCTLHVHSKGIVHADIKPMNVVRIDGEFKLIDLDAASLIGKDIIGRKSSSAYCPPEAIRFSADRNVYECQHGLIAHTSFDVWSLGCILYQMLHPQVMQLFQGDRDDNLTSDVNADDNLQMLFEWSDDVKTKKLSVISDNYAMNLLSRMLMKDPTKRITMGQVLAHPFVSGKKAARWQVDEVEYDAYLSYRTASDFEHATIIYDGLTKRGYRVYWDNACLKPGEDWEQGILHGIMSSRAFIAILSRGAINHPQITSQNFSNLRPDSDCDMVALDHRLGIEMLGFGLIERIFPVLIGDYDTTTATYCNYFRSGCHPLLPDISVKSVENKLVQYLDTEGFGLPLEPNRTILSVVNAIISFQGSLVVGDKEKAFKDTVDRIASMIDEMNHNYIKLNKNKDNLKNNDQAYLNTANPDMKRKIIQLYQSLNKDNGDSIMHIAAERGMTDVVKFLHASGKKIDDSNQEEITPFHKCVASGRVGVTKYLIEAGVDVNKCDNYGDFPLKIAVNGGGNCYDVLELLLMADTIFVPNDLLIKMDSYLIHSIKNCLTSRVSISVVKGVAWETASSKLTVQELEGFIIKCELSEIVLKAQKFGVWFTIISLPNTGPRVKTYLDKYRDLVTAVDSSGRSALDMAHLSNKDLLSAMFLWYGRYKLIDLRPEHISSTCYLFKATDELELDEIGSRRHSRVALKIMFRKDQFVKEVKARCHNFSPEYVIECIRTYPPYDGSENDEQALKSFNDIVEVTCKENGNLTKEEAERMFCVVMPLADRSLFSAMKQEKFTGKDQDIRYIKTLFIRLLKCVQHMHEKNILHADIKPLNIVRLGVDPKLIDFDAACQINKDYVGCKSSSAYCPPESIFYDKDSGTHSIPNDFLIAHPSFDIWSLGCILYQLIHPLVMPLFAASRDDTLTDDKNFADNLSVLCNWTDEVKRQKLSSIADPIASNLLSRMLMKSPASRISIVDILLHPFFREKISTGDSELHLVSSSQEVNALSRIENLLKQNPDVLSVEAEDGAIALHRASEVGNTEVVKLLLSASSSLSLPVIDKRNKSGNTPLHLASMGGHLDTAKILVKSGADVNAMDKYELSPLDLAASGGHKEIVKYLLYLESNEVILNNQALKKLESYLGEAVKDCDFHFICLLVCRGVSWKAAIVNFTESMIINAVIKDERYMNNCLNVLEVQNYSMWISICSLHGVVENIRKFMEAYPVLYKATDKEGRKVYQTALPENGKIIRSVFLWYGEYEVLDKQPLHRSETFYVFKASETLDAKENIKRDVAVKLLVSKEAFDKELHERFSNSLTTVTFDSKYVLPILRHHRNLNTLVPEISHSTGFLTKQQAESFHCIVTPLASMSLTSLLNKDSLRFSGRDLDYIRNLFKSLVECTYHIHSKGVIHNDIKTSKFVLIENNWNISVTDAACLEGALFCSDCSSAYYPPEAIIEVDKIVTEEFRSYTLKSYVVKTKSDNLTAKPSFDIWSLGCILYQLLHPRILPLFQGGVNDRLTDDISEEDNLVLLYEWTLDTKRRKLSAIRGNNVMNSKYPKDCAWAYDLLTLMLMKDPDERIKMIDLLKHPFITGNVEIVNYKPTTEEPEYDVFISYRVATNENEAEAFYNLLTMCGLRVFWDKKSLKDGEEWQEGFLRGVFSCRVFACILSTASINTFKSHKEESHCDNYLLELALAVELKKLNIITNIFPVMIGYDEIVHVNFSKRTVSGQPTLETNYVQYNPYGLSDTVEITALKTVLTQRLNDKQLKPSLKSHSAKEILIELGSIQGYKFKGDNVSDMNAAALKIKSLVIEAREKSASNISANEIIRKIHDVETAISNIKNVAVALSSKIASLNHCSASKGECTDMSIDQVGRRYELRGTCMKYRADCVGLKVPVRVGPAPTEPVVGYVEHGQEVIVRREITNGYFELVSTEPNGWLCMTFANVKWVPVDSAAEEEFYPPESYTNWRASECNPLLNSHFRPRKQSISMPARRNSVDVADRGSKY